MRRTLWVAMALLGLIAATAGAQMPEMQGMQMGQTARKPAPPAGPLKLTYGDQSAQWTAATLAALPHSTISVYNTHAKVNQQYSGVPLIDLLAKIGVPDKPMGKQLRIYAVAVGSDGYEVVFSLGEIAPNVHDGSVLVADIEDGKPITDDGPLKLVVTGEKGPERWVRNLVAVRVLTAD